MRYTGDMIKNKKYHYSGVPEGMKNWWCYYSPVLDLPKNIGGAINSTPILNRQILVVL